MQSRWVTWQPNLIRVLEIFGNKTETQQKSTLEVRESEVGNFIYFTLMEMHCSKAGKKVAVKLLKVYQMLRFAAGLRLYINCLLNKNEVTHK